jgi:acyl CoA:acetate/3-ketoacid CoA transferase
VGLHTFVDPERRGGTLNARTTEALVERTTVGGRDRLFYESPTVDETILRGTTADERGNISTEQEALNDVTFSIGQGLVGGIPAKGDIFGASHNPEAIVDATHQFDFYHGGGLDLTFLGMAQADARGHVNVSKFGDQLPGFGGVIDISQNTPEVVFCGSFAAGGLVHRVFDAATFADDVLERVRTVASNAPIATREAKRLLSRSPDRPRSAMNEEALALAHCVSTDDQSKAVAAFLKKRDPTFRNR